MAIRVPRVLVGTALAVAVTLAGCALQARTDVDPRFSVASCHSYAFADPATRKPEAAAAFGNPLNEKRLREAIADNLSAHGVNAAAEGTAADCAVGYAIGSRLAVEPGYPRFSWGLGMGWGGWGRHGFGGGSLVWDSPYAYREGRVTVDIYDVHSHQALWHAYVDADVTQLTGSEAEQQIKSIVAKIFAKFPAAGPAAAPGGRT